MPAFYDRDTGRIRFGLHDAGMSIDEAIELAALRSEIAGVLARLRELETHRCYSLAATKLEEADLWLGERLRRAP